MKIDGIIFDMDGVLVDIGKSYREAIRQTASYFLGRKVEKKEVDNIKCKIGMNNDWDATYALINIRNISYNDVKDYFQSKYLGDGKVSGLMSKEKLLISRDKLKRLKNKYRKFGIATGRSRQETLIALRNFNLGKFFPEKNIIAMEDTKEGKPSPAPLLLAKKRMRVSNPIYIGDTISDVVAAQQANIFCVYIGKEKLGDMQIDNVNNLQDVLL